jgi:hypothetical protein
MAKFIRSLDNLAREHTDEAMDTVHRIMSDPTAEDRDRLAAAREILDRGHGKPLTAVISLPANKRQAALLAAMSEEELEATIANTELPRLTQEEFDVASDPLLD